MPGGGGGSCLLFLLGGGGGPDGEGAGAATGVERAGGNTAAPYSVREGVERHRQPKLSPGTGRPSLTNCLNNNKIKICYSST